MWIAYNYEVAGKSHLANNLPCQDKTYFYENKSVKVLSLCDGAGSVKYSHFGAENVSQNIAFIMEKNFDEYFNENDALKVKTDILDLLLYSLKIDAKKHKCDLKDLASTLLFVAIKDNDFILFHLGDGVIGYEKQGILKVASSPKNGEFVNETYFTTSKNAQLKAKLFKGNLDEISAFIMMSDGGADGLYDKKSDKLGTSKLIKYASFHKNLKNSFKNSVEMLKNATFDDISLALITKKSRFKNQNLKFKKSLLGNKNRVFKRREKLIEILDKPLNLTEISHKIPLKKKFIKKDLDRLCRLNLIEKDKNHFKSLVYS